MRWRLLGGLAALVLLPLGAVAWLGTAAVADRAVVVEHELRAALEARLGDVDRGLAEALERRRAELAGHLDRLGPDPATIREQLRQWPRVGHVLVVDRSDGDLRFPSPSAPASEAEREFLIRTRTVWEGAALPAAAAGAEGAAARRSGWHGWYHHDGLHLLWWQAGEERIVAAEVGRVELLAELVASLPDTDDGDAARTVLVDAAGRVVYQWGGREPAEREPPRATIALSAPLAAWSLELYASAETAPAAFAAAMQGNLALGLAALALALLVLAAWIYRERTREMRVAAQRVSFVNQVSHELKTPLTNIRLYAELLSEEAEDTVDRGRLGVIVDESERLGRLIDNVLTFSRGQERRMRLRPATGDVDEVVRAAIESFEPALGRRGIRVVERLGAAGRAALDGDALRQIVANLLGNVEKHARPASTVVVESRREGGDVRVRVEDDGPGVPERLRARIFEPFVRASDALTEGVSGVGLGLDISRRLARLHGGDLELLPSEAGACFELRIHAPAPGAGEEAT